MQVSIFRCSEMAWEIRFPDYAHAVHIANKAVHLLAEALRRQPWTVPPAIVPAMDSLGLHFTSVLRENTSVLREISHASLTSLVTEVAQTLPSIQENVCPSNGNILEVPVRYGSEELSQLSKLLSISEDQIVRLHSETLLEVLFVGFSPGFPYMGYLPDALVTGRKASITPIVPAGSVAIANDLCGVYPKASPAGWWVIGHTDLVFFDPFASPSCLAEPGTLVRFIPI